MNQHPHLNHNWSHGISSCYANAFFYHRIAMHFLKLGVFPQYKYSTESGIKRELKKEKKKREKK